MTDSEFVKKHLIHNKIIFPTNQYDNKMAGFQNYGPIGLIIKNNIINVWRNIFIKNDPDNIYEIEAPVISHECVLTRSGHIGKFNDLGIIFYNKITDKVNQIKRADHFVEEKCQELKVDLINVESDVEIMDFLNKYNLYDIENEYVKISPVSLMFKMDNIGEMLYLRPEIAQTIFVEFNEFYNYNNRRLPFGIAQVGKSYRNEISDKPFVRLREFTQAEVEFFFNPFDKYNYEIPNEILNETCYVLSSDMQLANNSEKQILVKELTDYISDSILIKYIINIYNFAKEIGLDMNKIRFRQHKKTEMAHYAKDCWDLESNIFGKWLEIVGIAHRSNYDLTVHDKDSTFVVRKSDIPKKMFMVSLNAKKVFSKFDRETGIKMLSETKPVKLSNVDNVDKEIYNISEVDEYDMIVPSVIEPSIGIDRVFYTLICHSLTLREDQKRPLLLLNDKCCTYDYMFAQLSNNDEILAKLNEYLKKAKQNNIRVFTDKSGASIGKRYTRADEIGIRYTVTIDFETVKNDTVTIRDAKDMTQVRKYIDEIL